MTRIEELERICAEAYQVVGILADEAGRFEDKEVVKVLDNLSWHELLHDDVLPFPAKAPRPATPTVEQINLELLEALQAFIDAEHLLPQLSGPAAVAVIEARVKAVRAIARATSGASNV